ncbi:hypothetical protein HYFRA_00011626 [Hymenoscyphus fraxineus]|uniref:Uncharacterized protein n=1 Tax=Hymenoscyphus fraxineus TaxID=746836 RepID=A0A9N9PJF7_9HELO|nr:hypothetical protein HYFRA_00011626 [Hymenoscyphus fraxineus]
MAPSPLRPDISHATLEEPLNFATIQLLPSPSHDFLAPRTESQNPRIVVLSLKRPCPNIAVANLETRITTSEIPTKGFRHMAQPTLLQSPSWKFHTHARIDNKGKFDKFLVTIMFSRAQTASLPNNAWNFADLTSWGECGSPIKHIHSEKHIFKPFMGDDNHQ